MESSSLPKESEDLLCAEVHQLSLESDLTDRDVDVTALGYPHRNNEPIEPSSQSDNMEYAVGLEDFDLGRQRLRHYDSLLPFVARYEHCAMDWKAWANAGACLYQLGEKKASWDAYKQATLALRCFKVDVSNEEALSDPQVGKYLRTLDREFRSGTWSSDGSRDIDLFVVLVQCQRASEVATQRWHAILPNHYFAVTRILCEKLSSSAKPLENLCMDDSRMEMQQANTLALLASPEGMYTSRGENKRVRLMDSVRDICIEVRDASQGAILDFEVVEVQQPDDT